jgi:hypothetical protein
MHKLARTRLAGCCAGNSQLAEKQCSAVLGCHRRCGQRRCTGSNPAGPPATAQPPPSPQEAQVGRWFWSRWVSARLQPLMAPPPPSHDCKLSTRSDWPRPAHSHKQRHKGMIHAGGAVVAHKQTIKPTATRHSIAFRTWQVPGGGHRGGAASSGCGRNVLCHRNGNARRHTGPARAAAAWPAAQQPHAGDHERAPKLWCALVRAGCVPGGRSSSYGSCYGTHPQPCTNCPQPSPHPANPSTAPPFRSPSSPSLYTATACVGPLSMGS